MNNRKAMGRVLQAFVDDPHKSWYGLDLMRTVHLSSGRVYPALIRLEWLGWIDRYRENFDEEAVGRPRRTFYLLNMQHIDQARDYADMLAHEITTPRFPKLRKLFSEKEK